MSYPRRSPLLSRVDWLDHAFMAAGERPDEETLYNHQRHSARVVPAAPQQTVKSVEADGLITCGSRPIAVYTADCLPVLIADTRQRQVAAVHGGLKGVLGGIIGNAIAGLCQHGATPDSLYIAIGPAIGPCCYELGKDVIVAAQREDAQQLAGLMSWSATQPHNPEAVRPQAAGSGGVWFDLPLLAQRIALRAGVPEAQIERAGVCTYCMAEAQASYRRNGHFGHGYQQRFSWIKKRD